MKPEQLMQVWAATYAAEYVRLEATGRMRLVESCVRATTTADRAVRNLQDVGIKPTFEGYEKL